MPFAQQAPPPQPYGPPPGLLPQSYPPPGYPPPGYPPPVAPQPLPPRIGPYSPLVGRPLVSNETTWSLLSHLSIFALSIIGPIIIMLTEGKKSPYTRYHAVEALNMHLTFLIAEFVCILTFFLIVPLVLLFCLVIAVCVYGVIGAMAANRGELFRYPMIFRMVK